MIAGSNALVPLLPKPFYRPQTIREAGGTMAEAAAKEHFPRWKRAFDVLAIFASLPVVVPVALLVALLVRINLGSPVLFAQVRPGLGGRPFRMVKFRSMLEPRPGEPRLPDVQRLTEFGRFLRSSSLDELPELWNVLRGEMSLVGPRPLLMDYLLLYDSHQMRRHEVPPGITGWAQVNGRNALSWRQKFDYDVWYVDNQSMLLDSKILSMTVFKVVKRDGISAAGDATMPPFTGNSEGR